MRGIVQAIQKAKYLFVVAVVAASLTAGVVWPQTALAFGGGDGSSGNPYQIATCADIQSLNDDSSYATKNFILTADIDCAGTTINYIDFGGDHGFKGVLDGNGKTISNLKIDGDPYYLGLFYWTDGATIKNLTFHNVNMTTTATSGHYYISVLTGYASASTIDNVKVDGVINLSSIGNTLEYIGGIAGYSWKTAYSNIVMDTDITTAGGMYVGGLIGQSWEDSVSQVAVLGDIHGGDSTSVGGLMGRAYDTTVDKSFVAGNVTASSDEVGGFVGDAHDYTAGLKTHITNSYVRGNVTNGAMGAQVGGFASSLLGSTLTNVYAAGVVDATSGNYTGGLVGLLSEGGDTEHSFWNTTTSGFATSAGSEVGKTTAEMKNIATFTTNLGGNAWDFDTTWKINPSYNDGYPCLVWYAACANAVEEETPPVDNGSNDDNDGVSAAIENAAPNNGDGNGDGVADSEQSNVTSLVSPVSGKYVTVAVEGAGCALESVSITSESSHTAQDARYEYQTGFVNFTATCGQADVRVYYHDMTPANLTVRKYSAGASTPYFTIESATKTAPESPLNGTLVSYTIVDNDGVLDTNPAAGVITDPVALGSVVSDSATVTDEGGLTALPQTPTTPDTTPGAPNTGLQRQNLLVATIVGVAVALSVVALVVYRVIKRAHRAKAFAKK